MDFTSSGGEGFYEEEQMSKGKFPFSYPSPSSPSVAQILETRHRRGERPSPEEESDENVDRGETRSVEKEHMFDKVVTPSDVGKLNRLVIPKQHAEKYFPLDSSANEKGLLLNFEDRNGKPWRFRYSYWNSSQSYVMTKGWSRFVKEKKLDAGDIVSFHRGVGEVGKDRLYIDWRRRPDAPDHHHHASLPHHFPLHRSVPWSPMLLRPPGPAAAAALSARDHMHLLGNVHLYPYRAAPPVVYLSSAAPAVQWQHGGGGASAVGRGRVEVQPVVFESVPVVHGKAAAKRLRLFGVNMECPISESDECDVLSSTAIPHATIASQPSQLSSSSHPPLQLRLYNGTPLPSNMLDKGKPSSTSLDLDI